MMHSIFVFDAYGTLFDVHSAVARHRDAIGAQADRLSSIWRAKQMEYTWVRSLMGAYRDFETVTAEALDFAATSCGGIDPQARDRLLQAYRELEAFDDVRPTLQALRKSGARTAILSNGTPQMLAAACASAQLTDLFDAILSVEAVQIFKTHRRVYDLVGAHFHCESKDVSFQSSNRWDVAGAAHYGFHSVWVNRSLQPDEYFDHRPAGIIASLADLLEGV
jgi:2-haloacid dehalogenase